MQLLIAERWVQRARKDNNKFCNAQAPNPIRNIEKKNPNTKIQMLKWGQKIVVDQTIEWI